MQHIGFAAGFHRVPNPPADQYRREQQPRPRVIIPMMTPTTSVPAIVPNGLRRAMASSSDANVLACCLADAARSELVSATPLAASPTCGATASLMLRMVFAASPPACEARSAKVSFKLATSRLSWLKVSPKLSLRASSASERTEVVAEAEGVGRRGVCSGDRCEFMCVLLVEPRASPVVDQIESHLLVQDVLR